MGKKAIDFGTFVSRKETFIIAEIGKNFIETKEDQTLEHYLENAKHLIQEAKKAGADAVKFQTHQVEDEQMNIPVTSPHFLGNERYGWVTRNTLPRHFWEELMGFCHKEEIIFFSTPMSRGAAKILDSLDVPLWKVGSGDILDFVMLDYLASTGKPVIISSGMSTLEELDLAMKFLKKKNISTVLLHCVSKYPCSPEDMNLNTIVFLRKRYGVPVGFSDHSLGHDSVLAAIKLGAVVIEKHFSLSRDLFGADHKTSMTPDEFKEMVIAVRTKEKTFGQVSYGVEDKILRDDEAIFRPLFRKSLVFSSALKPGTVINPEMLYAMRPQLHIKGLPSERYESVIGGVLRREVKKYQGVQANDFE
ncbi:MAG: N-acetylneuraminate synthase family protein [bacterium]|nr:N-acetylneuraminate synthase family protein [bacterium]